MAKTTHTPVRLLRECRQALITEAVTGKRDIPTPNETT